MKKNPPVKKNPPEQVSEEVLSYLAGGRPELSSSQMAARLLWLEKISGRLANTLQQVHVLAIPDHCVDCDLLKEAILGGLTGERR